MKPKSIRTQRGISFIGLLFVGGVLAAGGVVLAQVVPTAIEYQAVIKASKRAAQEGGPTVAGVRAAFDRSAQIDNIESISGKDIEITKQGDKTIVSFSYVREIPLFGPAYLVLKYTGRSD